MGRQGSGVRPTHVTLNGKEYLVRAYRKLARAAIARQGSVAGSIVEARDARPEVLTWVLDDWSGGEGVYRFDPNREEHLHRYQLSNGPVDVSHPGSISLGESLTDGRAAVNTATEGPFLVSAGGNVWLGYQDILEEQTALDTWTERVATADADISQIKGMDSMVGFVYVGQQNDQIVRADSTGTTTNITTENGHAPIITNGFLWGFNFASATGTLSLFRWPLDESYTNAATTMGTLQLGFQSLSVVSPPVSYGPNIFFVVQPHADEARLFVWDGSALVERKEFPSGFRVHDRGFSPTRNTAVMNDVVFVGGYYEGATEVASVEYVESRGLSASLGSIREEEGTSMRVVSVVNTKRNELLIGTNIGTVFRYDMGTGGKSFFADLGNTARQVYDMIYSGGRYFYAWRNAVPAPDQVGVMRNAGTYPASVTVTHPLWHFGYPSQKKILYEIEIQTEPLPASTSVELQVLVDGATNVTTDINGATMAHSSGARSVFTLNTTGFHFNPKILLKTSNSANRPRVLSVTLRAQAQTKINYYHLDLDLRDMTAQRRTPKRQITGAKMIGELEALYAAGGTFTLKSHFPKAPSPYPRTEDSAVVMFANDEDSYDLNLQDMGKGIARLILREATG